LKDRACVVVARGRMRTVLVEFLDTGERVTTSARALRRPGFGGGRGGYRETEGGGTTA
jgi:hypothetical protein